MTLYKQAVCMICYNDVYAKRVFDVHCLWDDNERSGKPICKQCYFFLNNLVPNKIDIKIKRKKPKKIGLEKWIK